MGENSMRKVRNSTTNERTEVKIIKIKTRKCANCGAETNYYSMVYVDNLLVCTKCAMVQLRW